MSQSKKSKNMNLSQTKNSTAKGKSEGRLEQENKDKIKPNQVLIQRKRGDDYNISNRENFPQHQRQR